MSASYSRIRKGIVAFVMVLLVGVAVSMVNASESLASSYFNGRVPQNVVAKSDSFGKVKLSWDKMSGVDGYIVYTKTKTEAGLTQVKVTKATSCIHDMAWTDRYNFYFVFGYKKVDGKVVVTKPSKYAYSLPNVPASPNFKVKFNRAQGKVTISWDKVDGAYWYEVYEKIEGEPGSSRKAFVESDKNSVTVGTSSSDLMKVHSYTVYAETSDYVYSRPLPYKSVYFTVKDLTDLTSALTSNGVRINWSVDFWSDYAYSAFHVYRVENGKKVLLGKTGRDARAFYDRNPGTGKRNYYLVQPMAYRFGLEYPAPTSKITSVYVPRDWQLIE